AAERSAQPGDPSGAPRPSNRWIGIPQLGDSGVSPLPVPLPGGTEAPDDAPGPPLLTVGRAAMLSAGVLTLVGVRRRRRLRRRRQRARLHQPKAPIVMIGRRRRSIDPGERFLRGDLAVRPATGALVAAEQRVVAVIAADAGAIELPV